MKILGYQFDLTFGPLFTMILAPVIVYWISRIIGRVFDQLNKASEERHERLVAAIENTEKTFMKKLNSHCESQDKLHRQIDDRFWKHDHTDRGDVVIRGGM